MGGSLSSSGGREGEGGFTGSPVLMSQGGKIWAEQCYIFALAGSCGRDLSPSLSLGSEMRGAKEKFIPRAAVVVAERGHQGQKRRQQHLVHADDAAKSHICFLRGRNGRKRRKGGERTRDFRKTNGLFCGFPGRVPKLYHFRREWARLKRPPPPLSQKRTHICCTLRALRSGESDRDLAVADDLRRK